MRVGIRAAIVLLAALVLTPPAAAKPLSFRLQLGALESKHPVIAVSRMPGERWILKATGIWPEESLTLLGPAGRERKGASWEIETPKVPGRTELIVRRPRTGESATIHLFTMQPLDPDGAERLEGYRVGRYPSKPLRGLAIYAPPPGLIRVEAEDVTLPVSPNYRLGQFLSKQGGAYPKYLALRTRLLLKLEYLTEKLREHGLPEGGFTVMSGYRTPYYNHAIGNRRYSRHQWGGAADIYIDVNPVDGRMDDLNGDGRINRDDAVHLARLIEGLAKAPEYKPYVGGLGIYGANAAHGPFIHVDVRGTRARW